MFRFNDSGQWLTSASEQPTLDVSSGKLKIEYSVEDNANNPSTSELGTFEVEGSSGRTNTRWLCFYFTGV